jgi:pyruvate formate lyase activating enzyme
MFEFARDVARVAEPEGLEIVFVTNGQATGRAAEALAGFIHAANVDLKSFSKKKYRDVLGGSLAATKRTIEILFERGVWVEVTTLVIPGFNDSDEEISDIARYLADLSPTIPWHVSRFHPAHGWTDRPATPVETMRRVREIGLGLGLKYVYTGNLPGDDGELTHCPGCGRVVLDRYGYRVQDVALTGGRCKGCGTPIHGRGLT